MSMARPGIARQQRLRRIRIGLHHPALVYRRMQVGHLAVHQPQVQPLNQLGQVVVSGDIVQHEIVVGYSPQEIRNGCLCEGAHLIHSRKDAFAIGGVLEGRHGKGQAHVNDAFRGLVDLHDLVRGKPLDHRAAVGPDLHQPFAGEQAQGLTDRADAEPRVGCDLRFHKPVPGQVQTVADALLDMLDRSFHTMLARGSLRVRGIVAPYRGGVGHGRIILDAAKISSLKSSMI